MNNDRIQPPKLTGKKKNIVSFKLANADESTSDSHPLIHGRAPTPKNNIDKKDNFESLDYDLKTDTSNFFVGNSRDLEEYHGFYENTSVDFDIDDDEEELPADMAWSCETNKPSHNAISPTKLANNTNSKTFFLLLKSFIGTGVLFLPKAFSNGGLLFSVIVMIIIGYLTLHCMLLLVECERKLGGGYGEIGQKLYGTTVRKIVSFAIATSQMGFACAYYIFIAQNLQSLMAFFTNCRYVPSEWFCILLQSVLYVPLSWVRQIKHFSLSSLVADVFIVLGLLYVLGFDVMQLSRNGIAPDIVSLNTEKYPLFIGTAIFAYEGIGLMLPISQAMQHPEVFPWILSVTLLLLGAVMMVIGCAGYLAYGSTVETIAFLNLSNTTLTNFIQLLYVLAIVCSFPLTIYPALRISETYLFSTRSGKTSRSTKWSKNSYRALVVVGLAALAIAGSSSLDKFVSLIGSLACIPLSFIFPALFHVKALKLPVSYTHSVTSSASSLDQATSYKALNGQAQSDAKLEFVPVYSKWTVYKDYAIAAFGVFALFFSTAVTIVRWSQDGHDKPPLKC